MREGRIYQENNHIGRNATSRAIQDKILDHAGQYSDRHVGEMCGVSPATVSRLRRKNNIPVCTKSPQITQIGKVRACSQSVLDKARTLTAQGHMTSTEICKELGVTQGWLHNHCSFIRKYSGTKGLHSHNRPRQLSYEDAQHLITDCYLINWRRSDELRRFTFFLDKWNKAKRIWRCAY